jgi:hypothetical protein
MLVYTKSLERLAIVSTAQETHPGITGVSPQYQLSIAQVLHEKCWTPQFVFRWITWQSRASSPPLLNSRSCQSRLPLCQRPCRGCCTSPL